MLPVYPESEDIISSIQGFLLYNFPSIARWQADYQHGGQYRLLTVPQRAQYPEGLQYIRQYYLSQFQWT